MSNRKQLSDSELNEWFVFNDDGTLSWKKHSRKGMIGKTAGYMTDSGYIIVSIPKKGLFFVHRLVYAYHSGEWPEIVDHRNTIKDDNRIENLRPSNPSANVANTEKTWNKTGYRGVHEYKSGYRAETTSKGVRLRGVYRKDKREAYEDYLELRKEIHSWD